MTFRSFIFLLFATLAFRFWLAQATPISGDEAYFIYWGHAPDWGYYDHPPMIGWWLALLLQFSAAEWVLRLPSILLPAVLASGTAWYLRTTGSRHAWLGAALILLAPANVWNVLITTDTPLVFFSFFSALAFLRAARDDSPAFYALAGLMLGGAFLSKYFAVLLGVAYFLHVIIRPNRRKLGGFALLLLAALPAVALNLWWNWNHCWANLMFNLYNRHGDAGLSWKTPLLYAAMLLYLLTPPVLVVLARSREALRPMWRGGETRALMLIGLAPLTLFALLSLVRTVGLHWVLAFLPFVFILLLRAAPDAAMRSVRRFMFAFAALHVIGISIVANLPLETWRDNRFTARLYDGIVLTVDSQSLLEKLEPYARRYLFASDGYSSAVTLSFNAKRYFFVFGEASSHARHDDILTDFRALEGRDILVLRKTPPREQDYAPYFNSVEYKTLDVRGATFHLVLGHDFDYAAYRDTVLTRVRQRYYALPAYLPRGECYFCERYFPDKSCAADL